MTQEVPISRTNVLRTTCHNKPGEKRQREGGGEEKGERERDSRKGDESETESREKMKTTIQPLDRATRVSSSCQVVDNTTS